MKVIIAGPRDYYNYRAVCNGVKKSGFKITEVVSGHADGVDKHGERWAEEHKKSLKVFPADWKQFGRSAGYKRNAQMAEYAEALVAIWDLESPGTKSMIKLAKEHQLEIYIYPVLR